MKTNKILILSICAALVVAAAATGSFWFLRGEKKPESKDFSGQTPEQIRAYLRSEDFNSLEGQSRRAASLAARRQIMEYQVNEYFSLPEDKKGAYLDKLIDEIDVRRREFEQRRRDANDPNRPQRPQFARGAENMRARMESMDPMARAKMAAFREAMRARRQQKQ